MEVLDTGSPGALERWVASALARQWVRLVGSVAVVACLVGAWLVVRPDGPQETARQGRPAAAVVVPPGLRAPPLRGGGSLEASRDWKAPLDLAVRSGPSGHTVTFFAVNRSSRPLDPRWFAISAGFVDAPALQYKANCSGLTPRRFDPVRGLVRPGRRVFVRCHDITAYQGAPAWLDVSSIKVTAGRCHDSEGALGV